MNIEIRVPQNTAEQLKNAFETASIVLKTKLEANFSDLEYHNPAHSIGVSERTEWFLEGTAITKEELAVAKLAALGHDIDQGFTFAPMASGIGFIRKRATGDIEMASADYVLNLLGENGFSPTPEYENIIREAILGTVPGYDIELATVTQPNITENSRDTTWAVAASDLGSAGFDPEQFLRDGDAVWCEDQAIPHIDTLSDEESTLLQAELIQWTKNQISYAQGQKKYWGRDIVPEFIKNKLRPEIFDQSIQLCEERYNKRKNMSLAELLVDMGYEKGYTRFEEQIALASSS